MNLLTKRNFLAAIKNGNPADVAFYNRAFDENKEYPFEGEASTYLARAIWALRKSGMKIEEILMDKKCDYDYEAVGRYCKEQAITTKILAERIGIKTGVLTLIRCGSYPAGRLVSKVMEWVKPTMSNCRSAIVPVDEMVQSGNILDLLKGDPSVYDIQVTFRIKK